MSALNITLEELGQSEQLSVDVQLIYDFDPGEPMVRYYPDGSGYPGSPAYCEIVDIYVQAVYDCDGDKRTRKECGDWLPAITEIIRDIIFSNIEHYEERCLEEHCEEDYR